MVLERRSAGDVAFNVFNYTGFILFVLLCTFPFYYIFIHTISDNHLAGTGRILFLPVGIHLENYAQIMSLRGLDQAAMVSVGRTVFGTLGTLVGTSFVGYAMSKREYWHRQFWYRFVIITMYFNAGLVPWYLTMRALGLTNNFLAYILPGIVAPFFVILFKTYVEQISPSLEESAQIDGAGYLTRYTRIVLPVSIPILATIAIFTSVGQWNAFSDTLFLMTRSRYYTLQFVLYQYLTEVDSIARLARSAAGLQDFDPRTLLTPTSVRMTITMVVVLPVLLVYPFMQRYFVKGIMIGAIKG